MECGVPAALGSWRHRACLPSGSLLPLEPSHAGARQHRPGAAVRQVPCQVLAEPSLETKSGKNVNTYFGILHIPSGLTLPPPDVPC